MYAAQNKKYADLCARYGVAVHIRTAFEPDAPRYTVREAEGLRHHAAWHEVLDKSVDLQYFYRDRSEP